MDSSDLKEAEGSAAESRDFPNRVINGISDPVFVLDRGHRLVLVNDAGCRLLGRSREQLLGAPDHDCFSTVQTDESWQRDEAVLETGAEDLHEEEVSDAGGNIRTVVTRRSRCADPLGNLHLVGIIRDITDARKVEEELRRTHDIQRATESLLRLSLDDVPLASSLQRALELVLSIPLLSLESRGAILLTGYKPGTLRMVAQGGLSDAIRASCAEVPFGHCLCGRAASTQALQFCDRIYDDHDVRYPGMIPHGHYCVPILWSGRVLGVMVLYLREGHPRNEREIDFLQAAGDAIAGVVQLKTVEIRIRDLNVKLEQRVRERTVELEAANGELEAFSYSVSHDLRAPLRAIEGFAEVVLMDHGEQLDPEEQRLLGAVRANARRMSKLIDDLLTFSRTGRSELGRTRMDMRAIVQDAIDEVASDPRARAKIDFRLESLPETDGDASLIRQVWLNLLSNAVKFSARAGHPVIEVGGTPKGNFVVYHVRDNGAGFDPQFADKLFGVFQRLHDRDEFEGTGIGLALVKRIAERHGGQIWAEGEPDKGATLSFSLPALHGPDTSPR
jgi:PAS domain S-box-containing protein